MTCDDDGWWRVRYRKQILVKEIGLVGQQRIMGGSVLVVGAGGLGGIVSILLVRAGVGKVRIVDSDAVQEENLHRQLLFTEADVRAQALKASAAARALQAMNSRVEVEWVATRATKRELDELLDGMTVAVDATDNFATRDALNAACLSRGIPWVYGGVLGTAGACMTIVPRSGPCLRCLFPTLPDDRSLQTTNTVGVLPTLPAIIGSVQVTEVLRILAEGTAHGGSLLQLDPWYGDYRVATVAREPSCPACGIVREGGG